MSDLDYSTISNSTGDGQQPGTIEVVLDITIRPDTDPHPTEPHTADQLLRERLTSSDFLSGFSHCEPMQGDDWRCFATDGTTPEEIMRDRVSGEFWYLSESEQCAIVDRALELYEASWQLILQNPDIF
jgi:hypothetical protein